MEYNLWQSWWQIRCDRVWRWHSWRCGGHCRRRAPGARTLLLERTFTVGGMLTLGDAGITKFSEHCRDAQVYKAEVLDVLGTNPRSVQVAGGIPP